MAAIVNGVGAATPDASSATLVATIPASAQGNALTALAFFVSPTSRSFSSPGSAWSPVFDDGSNFALHLALAAATGTVAVTADAGAPSAITMAVAEILGLAPAGTPIVSTLNTQSSVTAWSTPSITITKPSLAFAVSSQPTDGAATSVFGPGWTPLPGSGLTAGTVSNPDEGNSVAVAYKVFPAGGTISASGTWSMPVLAFSYIVAFEILAYPETATGRAPDLADLGIPNSALSDVRSWWGTPAPLGAEKWFADELGAAGDTATGALWSASGGSDGAFDSASILSREAATSGSSAVAWIAAAVSGESLAAAGSGIASFAAGGVTPRIVDAAGGSACAFAAASLVPGTWDAVGAGGASFAAAPLQARALSAGGEASAAFDIAALLARPFTSAGAGAFSAAAAPIASQTFASAGAASVEFDAAATVAAELHASAAGSLAVVSGAIETRTYAAIGLSMAAFGGAMLPVRTFDAAGIAAVLFHGGEAGDSDVLDPTRLAVRFGLPLAACLRDTAPTIHHIERAGVRVSEQGCG